MSERIGVAMSGGVDSSVAAYLLKEAGHDIVGLTFTSQFHPPGPGLEDARRVAEALGIEHHALDLSEGFAKILDAFCREYLAGRTPNPCARCNPSVKFGLLLEHARKLGCTALATGHYARIQLQDNSRWALARAAYVPKDQTYFLFGLSQEQLRDARFPLGELSKPEVRAIASRIGLHVTDKAESQEICIAPDKDYPRLLREHCPEDLIPGDIVDTAGKVLGRHPSIAYFTLGQRRGLGVATGRPMYVVALDPANNRVVLGTDAELFRSELVAREVNWGAIPALAAPRGATVQIRYRHRGAAAELIPVDAGCVRVRFETPQRAITPGQVAVFYENEVMLGGGWIRSSS